MNEHSFIFAPDMRIRDEAKEQAIRQKALETIVKEGFDRLSMQKLAKAAGVSPATIYIYFKDREDLIMQLCLEESRRMIDLTLKGFDPSMSFAQGLRVQWKNRAAYWFEYPLQAQFLEQVRHSPYHEKVFPLIKSEFSQTMKTFVQGAITRGELVKVSVEVYWSVAFAPLYQLVKYHIAGKGLPGNANFTLDEKTLNQTLDLVLKALKP